MFLPDDESGDTCLVYVGDIRGTIIKEKNDVPILMHFHVFSSTLRAHVVSAAWAF